MSRFNKEKKEMVKVQNYMEKELYFILDRDFNGAKDGLKNDIPKEVRLMFYAIKHTGYYIENEQLRVDSYKEDRQLVFKSYECSFKTDNYLSFTYLDEKEKEQKVIVSKKAYWNYLRKFKGILENEKKW